MPALTADDLANATPFSPTLSAADLATATPFNSAITSDDLAKAQAFDPRVLTADDLASAQPYGEPPYDRSGNFKTIPEVSGDVNAPLNSASDAVVSAQDQVTHDKVQAQSDAYDMMSRRFSALQDMASSDPQKQAALQQAFEHEAARMGVTQIGQGSIPKTTPDQIKTLFPSAPDWVTKATAGLFEGAEGASEALAGNPWAVATAGAGMVEDAGTQITGKLIGAGMLGQMAVDYPAQVDSFTKALRSGNTEDIFKEAVPTVLTPLMLRSAAKGGIYPDWPREPLGTTVTAGPPDFATLEPLQLTQGDQNANTTDERTASTASPPSNTAPGPGGTGTGNPTPAPGVIDTAGNANVPAQEILKPQLPVAPVATGAPFVVSTPVEGAKVAGRFDLVEQGDLVSSFDSGFDPALQPRDRDRAASVNQIASIVQKFEPQRLGDSPTSDMGAPMVDDRNQVLSGNGRTAALRTIYQADDPRRADDYRQWLTQNAKDFGLDPSDVSGMSEPVLVRRISNFGDIDPVEFARQSNQQQVLGMGEAEKAVSDAKMLQGNPGLMSAFQPGEDGDVMAAGNRGFLNKFIQGTGDQATLLTKDGYNAPAVIKRVKNAILGAFVGPENQQLMSKLVEGADELNMKTAVNGVMTAAPALMKFKGTPYDLTPVVHQALKDLVTIRSSGQKVQDFLSQSSLFGDADRTGDSDTFLEHFATARSVKAVAEKLTSYTAMANQALQDAQSGGMFGDKPATREELVKRIYASTAANQGQGTGQTDLTLGKPPARQAPGSPAPQPAQPSHPGGAASASAAVKPKYQATLYQGRGATPEQIYGPDAVKEGRAVPVLGPGEYYANDPLDARNYGEVTKHSVSLENPYIIDSDVGWRTLLTRAQTPALDSRGEDQLRHPEWIKPQTEKLQRFLRGMGYDGVIVKIPDGDVNERGEVTKSIAETFAHSQVVKFAPKTFPMASGGSGKPPAPTPAPPAPAPPPGRPPPGTPPGPITALASIKAHFAGVRRFFQNLVSPQNIDPGAKIFSTFMREHNAEAALHLAQADERLAVFRKLADRTPVPRNWTYDPSKPLPWNYEVMHLMETDRHALPANLQAAAQMMDDEFAWRIGEVQAINPNAMQNLIANYFPHLWKDPDSAAVKTFMAEVAGRNPFEGSKAFMKQRTVPFIVDGLARGLVPANDNWVDMALAKMHQMDKFLAARHILNDAAAAGMYKYLPIGQAMPDGWKIIDDPAFTTYAPPYLEVREAFDAGLRKGLMSFIKKMGFRYERVASLGVGTWGMYTTGGKIQARFGSPDLVIMHELGHGLDERYGLHSILAAGAGADELKKLADLRSMAPGARKSSSFKKYAQTPEEQVANALHAYMYAPELMAKTAPAVQANMRNFIRAHPELHDLDNIKPSLAIASSKMRLPLAGPVLAGHYIMPDGAAQVLTNHLGPTLNSWQAFRTLRAGSNLLNAAQLGFSGFHVGFTSLDATFSTLGTAITEAFQGNFVSAGTLAARALVAPVQNYYVGKALQREMLKPGSGSIRMMGFKVPYDVAKVSAIADLAVKGGLRATIDPFWKTTFTRSLVRAWHEQTIAAKSSIPFLAPMSAIEMSMKPIAEWIVPRQKLGVFATLAKSEMLKLGPGASADQVRLAMARAADSTENRMGQMTYDNLFYNRIVKDVLLLAFRAYGWQLGKYRELSGAVADTVRAGTAIGKQAAAIGSSTIGYPPKTPPPKPQFTNRMGYVIALIAGSALIGAILHRMFTGKSPQTAMDYFHPAIGIDDQGRPSRISMPTYAKDLESDWHDFPNLSKMGESFYHKLNPALSASVDLLRNRDFYDVRIRNEDDPVWKQQWDNLRYLLKTAEPFSLTGTARLKDQNAGTAALALPFFGFVPAKKSLTMTPAENRAAQITQDNLPQGTRTQEQYDHSKLLSALAKDLRTNPTAARAEIQNAAQLGQLKETDLPTLISRATLTPLQYQVKRMTPENSMQVWDLASPAERQTLQQEIAQKLADSKTLDPEVRQRYFRILFKPSGK